MTPIKAQLLTLRSLFGAMASIQLVTAASGTIVALYFAETGASQAEAALAPAFYSLGFLAGCFYVSKWISEIGHIRALAASAAICIASALLFSAIESVPVLLAIRFATGVATAAIFAIGDAWISDTVSSSSRGRMLAIYAVILGLMSVGSQILVIVTPGDLNQAFVLVSLCYCLAIVVIAATRTNPPQIRANATVRLKETFGYSLTAVVGVFAVGIVSAILLSVAPYRAAKLGIEATEIAYMIGALYLGRILFQYPLGWLSDQVDRHLVILAVSVVTAVLLLIMATLSTGDGTFYSRISGSSAYFVMLGGFILLGGSLLTMYSLLVAQAIDRTPSDYAASSSVTLLFAFTLGGIAGPIIASFSSLVFGNTAIGWLNFAAMFGFCLTSAWAYRYLPAVTEEEQTQFALVEPTSVETATVEKQAEDSS
jgi:MFS family permease